VRHLAAVVLIVEVLSLLTCCRRDYESLATTAHIQKQTSSFLHDFGTIDVTRHRVSLSHAFTITNNSHGNLEITGIKTTCGCLLAGVDKFDLAPQESTELRLGMDLLSAGDMTHSATVVFSDGTTQRFVLTAVGVIPYSLTVILSSACVHANSLQLPLRLYSVSESASEETEPPLVTSPSGIRIQAGEWITLERHSDSGVRPTRQVLNASLDFTAYDGDYPIEVEISTARGTTKKVIVYGPFDE